MSDEQRKYIGLLGELPEKLIEMMLTIRAQMLIRRKDELDKKSKVHRTVD